MGVLDRAVMLLQAKNYPGSGDWADASGNGHNATLVNAPTFTAAGDDSYFTLDGVDQYLNVADHADLDFAADEPLTVMVRARAADVTPAAVLALVVKRISLTGSAAGYALYNATNGKSQIRIGDGAANSNDIGGNFADNVVFVAAGVRNIIDDDLEAFTDGVGSGTPTADNTTVSLANAFPLRIGATSGVAASFYDGDFFDAVLWREALPDADVAAAGVELAAPTVTATRRLISSPRYGITRMARR